MTIQNKAAIEFQFDVDDLPEDAMELTVTMRGTGEQLASALVSGLPKEVLASLGEELKRKMAERGKE